MLSLKKIFEPRITFYDKCAVMPLWNFQEYLKTNDLRYFTAEFKEHKDLYNIMTNLFGEWIALTENQAAVNRFGLMFKIMKLTGKYETVTLLLKAAYNFSNTDDITQFYELIDQIEKWNYKIDRSKDVFGQLEKISQRLQGIKTHLELLEAELKDEDTTEAATIESQLISTSRILDLGYRLNAKEITLLEWHEYREQIKKVDRDNQKLKAKR